MKKFTPAELTLYTGRLWSGDASENNIDSNQELELCFDSRNLKDGMIFWPIAGERFDAHDFINDLIEKGNHVFAAEKSWLIGEPHLPGDFFELLDSTKDLGLLASNYAKSLKVKKIAITGSNGKTTTKEMIKSVLGEKASATKGNLNNHIGVPFTLLELTQDHDYAIVEAGTNHNGEIEYLSELIRPNVCVVTNIGESHIEYFETRENIYKEKTSLMNHMDQDGLIVLCAEDDLLRKYIPKPGQNLISYGIQHGINRPSELRWNSEGCAVFEFDGEEFEVNAPGEHNLLNALCAISIGKYFELEISEIKNRLSLWKPANMRSEFEVVNDVTLFKDCYNSNPTSAKAALKVMEQKETDGQKIVVFGDMGELGNLAEHYHNDIAKEMLKMNLDLIYLCGPSSKVIEKTLLNQKRENVFHFDSIEELTKSLKQKVAPKDLILFKASRSMKFDKIIESIKETR